MNYAFYDATYTSGGEWQGNTQIDAGTDRQMYLDMKDEQTYPTFN